MEEEQQQQLLADKQSCSPSAAKRFFSVFAALGSNQLLRSALSHLGLFSTLVVYTALGGLVFRALERPGEVTRVAEAQNYLWDQRLSFISSVANFNSSSGLNFPDFLRLRLSAYEESICGAVQQGVLHVPRRAPDIQSASEVASWGYLHSIFFASTVLTTIGYGNVAPVTFWGRAFCVAFALVGIPLTLTVIADLGRIIASSLTSLGETLREHLPCVAHLLQATDDGSKQGSLGIFIKSVSFFAAILLLLVYIAAGAALFTFWEDWTFFEGFYFCFITLTTIGFGDLVPKEPDYMLLCTLYILVGLAMTSTIIELVRRQYAQSWKRMKELSARLQSLSGPITDALKRIDLSRASSTIDLTMLHELRDLKKTLTLTQLETKLRFPTSKKNEWQKEMEAAMQEIVQLTSPPKRTVVIYETSV
ncbi:TWiK family of potassium channels protein 7-like [Cloeon dipterum]|uniref:TWiK family of potassium channels protein 7-like n=1 Tax=Cloeon dipterum TaxID=197152 RepID=UPI00321FC794